MTTRTAVALCLLGCLNLPACDNTPASGDKTAPSPQDRPPPLKAGPHWVCDEPTWDFGEVWAGVNVKHSFQFQNRGDQLLKVLSAKPRCSCSVSENYTKQVPPGEAGVIPFVLGTKNKSAGRLDEWLTITTNDPQNPDMKITLTGIIRTVVQPEVIFDAAYERAKAAGKPARLNKKMKATFGKVKSTDRLHRVIKLRNTSGQPLAMKMLPLSAKSRFQASLQETVPGEEFELTVTCEPPIPVGTWSTALTFQTSIPDQPTYTIVAHARVPTRVEVIPGRIVIDQSSFRTKERKIRIVNHGDTPVELLAISTSDPRFEFEYTPPHAIDPKTQFITVKFPGEAYRPPPYGEVIEIRTNDPEWGVTRIPVLPSMKRLPTPRPPNNPLILHPAEIANLGT